MNAAVRRIRREVRQIGNDIADMTATLVRIGERSDWTDARIALIEADIRSFEWQRATLVMMARVIEDAAAAAIRAIVSPPTSCPSCDAEAGRQSPAGTTSRHCERHIEELRQAVAARKGVAA